jgi:hypothetical protein
MAEADVVNGRRDDVPVQRRSFTAFEWIGLGVAFATILNVIVAGWLVSSVRAIAKEVARDEVAIHDTSGSSHTVPSSGLGRHLAVEGEQIAERNRMAEDIRALRTEVRALSDLVVRLDERLSGQQRRTSTGQSGGGRQCFTRLRSTAIRCTSSRTSGGRWISC